MDWKLFTSILIALISLIGKSLWDIYHENRKRKIEFLEKQLSQFYYPIVTRLEKDNVTWRLILDKRQKEPSLKQKIGENVERNIILPNHDEIVNIIEKNTYLCQNKEINDLLIKYVNHVAIFKAIRASGDELSFPMDYDISYKWPSELYPKLVEKMNQLQKELNKLIWK